MAIVGLSGGDSEVSNKSAVLLSLLFSLLPGCVGEKPTAPVTDSSDANTKQIEEQDASPVLQPEEAAVELVEGIEPTNIELDAEIGKLLSNLGDGETETRIAASSALSQRADEVVGQHADWMQAGTVSQRRGLMLMMTGKAQAYPTETFSLITHALKDDDSKVRSIAVQLVRQLLPAQAGMLHATLLEMMKSPTEESGIRVSVLRLISFVPGDALATETTLGEVLLAEGEDPSVQQAALYSYVKLAPAEPAITTLINVVESSPSNEVKRTATILLGKYGTKSKASVEVLGDLLETEDENLQEAAAEALARIGSPSIDVLVSKLDSPMLLTRQMAIFTLGVIGPSAREHVQRLEMFISDDDTDTSIIAKEAIFSILKPR
tara:strand:+ start:4591 stop:5724 length:1134 start_codon:yes stop_codon:yes gene_type:complete